MEEVIIGTIAGLTFQCQLEDGAMGFQVVAPHAESFC